MEDLVGMSAPRQLPEADLSHILANTKDLWKDFRGGRVFITGGTGFFGCWLLETFVRANETYSLDAKAVVLTRDREAFCRKAPHLVSDPTIALHEGDVRSCVFPSGTFSHVIHAATDSDVKTNDEAPAVMFDTIVSGTRRTLDFACSSGARKVLFVSSGAVYGRQPADLTHVDEDFSGGPDISARHSAYGEGKRAAESLCRLYSRQYGIEIKVARCFAFVGPHLPLHTHFAIGNFIRNALCGDTIQVNGDGTPYRSYLYAADLTIWLWSILVRGESSRAYNVGSDEPITIAELASLVREIVDPTISIRVRDVPRGAHLPERYVPSIDRARHELALRCHIPLREAIRRTAAWYADQERDLRAAQ